MGSVERLTLDLQAERQKLALYEKNLRGYPFVPFSGKRLCFQWLLRVAKR